MFDVRQTPIFARWLDELIDQRAAEKITQRIVRIRSGLLGDVKFFGGIGEVRIDHGPGYRVYFVKRGRIVIVLLCGGDKRTQKKDIQLAIKMAKEIR